MYAARQRAADAGSNAVSLTHDENESCSIEEVRMVRTEGIEPSREFPPYGFSYHFGLRRRVRVRGLDYST
jgi:hypothetical protein